MAIDAVKRFGDVIRASPELKNNPSLAPLRSSLLREPQAFFKGLRDRLEADKETSPDSLDRLATASTDLGNITNEIGDRQDALRDYERATRDPAAACPGAPVDRGFPGRARWRLSTPSGPCSEYSDATPRPSRRSSRPESASASSSRRTRRSPPTTGNVPIAAIWPSLTTRSVGPACHRPAGRSGRGVQGGDRDPRTAGARAPVE